MTNINSPSIPGVVNRAFVPLAIEAGIEDVIVSLVGMWALSKQELLERLIDALESTNPPLASAFASAGGFHLLDAVLAYMATRGKAPVVDVRDLPPILNANGPASVTAARDGGIDTQVNITFAEHDTFTKYAIYLDGIFQKAGGQAPSVGYINDNLTGVVNDAQQHSIRVLFVDLSGDEPAVTRFGPIAYFT